MEEEENKFRQQRLLYGSAQLRQKQQVKLLFKYSKYTVLSTIFITHILSYHKYFNQSVQDKVSCGVNPCCIFDFRSIRAWFVYIGYNRLGRGGRVSGVVVVCRAWWSCVGRGGRVSGAVVVCGTRWSCVDAVVVCGRGGRVWGAVVMCRARWSCVGRGGRVWGAMVVCGTRWSCGMRWSSVGRGGRVSGAVVLCGARWSCVGRGGVGGAQQSCVGRSGRVVGRWTFVRGNLGSKPPAAV